MDALQTKLQALVEGKIVSLSTFVLYSAESPPQDFEGQKQVEHVVHVTLVAATVSRPRDRPVKLLIPFSGYILPHRIRVAIIMGHIRCLRNVDCATNSRKSPLCGRCRSG